jgi:hypothetical protein
MICPRLVRTDKGTENGHITIPTVPQKKWQRFTCRKKSFLTGSSNQRIECWWGFLRRECIEFWLWLFHDLKDRGLYDGGLIDKNTVQFCFMSVIQVSTLLIIINFVLISQLFFYNYRTQTFDNVRNPKL